MESDSGLARYSVIGFKPTATLKAQNGILKIENEDETLEFETPNPFDEIKSIIGNGSSKRDSAEGWWDMYPMNQCDTSNQSKCK